MKFALLLLLTSCATTPVTFEHWSRCYLGCGLLGVKEACVTVRGPACTCSDGYTFWIDEELEELEELEEIDIMGF